MIRRFFHSGLVYIFVLFGLNVFVQTYTVGKYANVATDEGVDLYASQLVSNGLVPYKDFFLGHLPLWIYINAWLFQLVGNNLTTFHYTYVVWVSSTIFPIFLSVQVLTKKQFGAIAACVIFLTFPEMVQWDFHFFALRQASLPFLAWGVYCLITKRFPRLTGLLFALFGASLFSNYFVTIMLLASYLWRYSQSHFNNKARYYRTLVATFVLFTAGYWLLVWSIPNSISNIFVFQTSRYFYTLGDRLQMILNLLELNWVFFLFATVALVTAKPTFGWLRIFTILTLLCVIFVGNTFLPHYLVTASVGICLAIGVSLNSLRLRAWARATFLLFYLLLAYVVSGNHLRYNLIEAQSPDFFYTVAMLERLPGPLLTLEPIYAVFAQKTITPFYMMADPRYYDVANRTIPDSLQFALIAQSQTILLDNHTRALLSQDSILQIQATHQLVGLFGESEIWSVPH